MRHIVFSSMRDVPFFLLFRQAFYDYRLLTLFVVGSALFHYVEGQWQGWHTFILSLSLALIAYMLVRSFGAERRLYNSIFDAVAKKNRGEMISIEERIERFKMCIATYENLRGEQRRHAMERWPARIGDTLCSLLVIASVVQMLMLRFR